MAKKPSGRSFRPKTTTDGVPYTAMPLGVHTGGGSPTISQQKLVEAKEGERAFKRQGQLDSVPTRSAGPVSTTSPEPYTSGGYGGSPYGGGVGPVDFI